MERLKTITILLLAAACTVLLCLLLRQSGSHRHDPRNNAEADTTTTVIYDTIKITIPSPRDSGVTRHVTARLPIARDSAPPTSPPDSLATDSCTASLPARDSVDVVIPITTTEYQGDDYHAWVSGYRATLDSLYVYPRHERVTITVPRRPPRWSIGLQAGYGITPRGLQPYIGLGLSCTFAQF